MADNFPRKRGRPKTRYSKKVGDVQPTQEGNPSDALLAATGSSTGNRRATIAPIPKEAIVEPLKHEIEPIEEAIQEVQVEASQKEPVEPKPEQLGCFSIKEGNNEIKITLTKQKNRMIKLEFFLNGAVIRPATFTGSSAASNYWALLKGMLR